MRINLDFQEIEYRVKRFFAGIPENEPLCGICHTGNKCYWRRRYGKCKTLKQHLALRFKLEDSLYEALGPQS